ncbi:unnamed protein product [Effrenium voratum]|nr:unnamed protein product [Effrenium voratum]
MAADATASPDASPDGDGDRRSVAQVVEDIGYGPSQVVTSSLVNGSWLADGCELLVLSSVGAAVAAEWQLSAMQQGALLSAVYVGVLLGNLCSGLVGDTLGRRVAVLLCFPVIAIVSVASAAAWSFGSLLCLRFLVGLGFGTGQPSAVAILMEVSPAKFRPLNQALAQLAFALGELYCCLVMWYDDPSLKQLNWRWLLMANALPAAVFWLLSWPLLQESPVFSVAKGKLEEAHRTLDLMRRWNSKPDLNIGVRGAEGEVGPSFWKQLPGILTGSTFALCLVCFSYNLTIYGAFTAFPQLLPRLLGQGSRSPVAELARGAFMEIPGDVMGLVFGLSLPRKWVLYVYFLGLGISSLLFCSQNESFILLGYYGSKAFPQLGSVSLYVLAAESFGPAVRASGTALVLAVGRLGACVAPLFYELLVTTWSSLAFFYTSAGLMLLCALVTLVFVPETFCFVAKEATPLATNHKLYGSVREEVNC